MRQICYTSRASGDWVATEMSSILRVSRTNNDMDYITGLLLSDGRGFIQALEGARDVVGACYERIRNDPRHHDIVTVIDRPIGRREFGEWSMIHHAVDVVPSRALRDAVKADTMNVTDMHLRALFIGFAVLARNG